MLPTLRTDKRILEDFKKYQDSIDRITNEPLKEELSKLLKRLKEQVGHIDRNHEQLIISGRIPTEISEIRSNIASIKKSLDSKIDAWNRSNNVMPAPLPNVK